jgi:hypothetical protein
MTEPRHAEASLLPPNASPIMTTLSLVSAEHRDRIPWDDLPAAFDPARCPERLLPWLATVFSVDVWDPEWPVQKRREVIATEIQRQRLKGTLAGIRAYLDLLDVNVPRAVTPPAKFFLSAYTPEDHQAWLRTLPEIRVYHGDIPISGEIRGALSDEPENLPDDTIGASRSCFFLADEDDLEVEKESGALFAFPIDPEAPTMRSILRAELIENGVTTILDMEAANETGARGDVQASVERLYFPGRRGRGLYLSILGSDDPPPGVVDHACLIDGQARRYAAYIRRSGDYAEANESPIVRGREVVDDDPVRVAYGETRVRAAGFLDRVNRMFLSYEGDQKFEFYESWRLVDRSRPATKGPLLSYLDRDRFSIGAYTAELTIDAQEPLRPGKLFLNASPLDRSHLHQSDYALIGKITSVARVAKAVRDVVLLNWDYGIPTSIDRVYSLDELTMR